MTIEERENGFRAGIQALEKQFGLSLALDFKAEQLGPAFQVRPEIILVQTPGWQAPITNDPATDDGE